MTLNSSSDNCEVCGSVYAPTDLINPYSAAGAAGSADADTVS